MENDDGLGPAALSGTGLESKIKTFEYSEDGPGAYTIMVIRMVNEGNRLMERAGWSGSFHYFLQVDGGIRKAEYDSRKFANAITAADDDYLLDLLRYMETPKGFHTIVDGATITPNDIDQMVSDG